MKFAPAVRHDSLEQLKADTANGAMEAYHTKIILLFVADFSNVWPRNVVLR